MSNVGVEGLKNPFTPIFSPKKYGIPKKVKKYVLLDNTNKPMQVGFFNQYKILRTSEKNSSFKIYKLFHAISGHTEDKRYLPWQLFDKTRGGV